MLWTRHPGCGSPRSLQKRSPLLAWEQFSLLWYNKDQALDFEGSECLRQAAFMISNPEFSVHVVAHACHPIALESPSFIKPCLVNK